MMRFYAEVEYRRTTGHLGVWKGPVEAESLDQARTTARQTVVADTRRKVSRIDTIKVKPAKWVRP